MKQQMLTLLMALGLVFAQLPVVFAEEAKKSLKELLLEKGVISKDEAASVQETKLSKWVDRITFSGDFRLRHESFMKDPDKDRHRQRFRLRVGPEITVQDFTVGIRLASGTGEQVSTNQSFDNLFSLKEIFIDRAFLRWKGVPGLTLTGGRMPNPFFTVYTTDLIWDEDVNPEGFSENFTYRTAEAFTMFANLSQFVLDEDSGDNNDQWLFGQQVGITIEPKKDVKVTLAAAYYEFTNTHDGNFGQNVVQEGNTRITLPDNPNTLLNDFDILDLTARVGMKVGAIPFSLMADYVRNLGNPKTTTGQESGDTGYQVGFILGKASGPLTWEFGYFYKFLETDATVADLADSDFGDGGTNRKGHIVWGAVNPTQFLQFKVKFFNTRVENETLPPNRDDIDRLQVDLSLRF